MMHDHAEKAPRLPESFPPEPLKREFVMITNGLDKEIDMLGVCVLALNELSDLQKASIVTYLCQRYGVLRT